MDGVTNFYIQSNKETQMKHTFTQESKVFDGLEYELMKKTHFFPTYNCH